MHLDYKTNLNELVLLSAETYNGPFIQHIPFNTYFLNELYRKNNGYEAVAGWTIIDELSGLGALFNASQNVSGIMRTLRY